MPGVVSIFPLPGRQRLEDRLEPRELIRRRADHQAVAALEPPHAAAGADVDVGDALGGQLLRAADVVLEVGVAAVDDGVALAEAGAELAHRLLGDLAGRHHAPRRLRRLELRHELVERGGAGRALGDELLDGRLIRVEHDRGVPAAQQPAHHVRAHPTESDHANLHREVPAERE